MGIGASKADSKANGSNLNNQNGPTIDKNQIFSPATYLELREKLLSSKAKDVKLLSLAKIKDKDKITDDVVHDIAKNCPSLTYLNLDNCKKISYKSTVLIALFFPKLTELHLEHTPSSLKANFLFSKAFGSDVKIFMEKVYLTKNPNQNVYFTTEKEKDTAVLERFFDYLRRKSLFPFDVSIVQLIRNIIFSLFKHDILPESKVPLYSETIKILKDYISPDELLKPLKMGFMIDPFVYVFVWMGFDSETRDFFDVSIKKLVDIRSVPNDISDSNLIHEAIEDIKEAASGIGTTLSNIKNVVNIGDGLGKLFE